MIVLLSIDTVNNDIEIETNLFFTLCYAKLVITYLKIRSKSRLLSPLGYP